MVISTSPPKAVSRLVSFIAITVLALFLAITGFSQSANAQDTSGDAAAEDSGPAYPAGLDNPDIDLVEFELRLIPLTVGELEALAQAWQDIVRARTDEVVQANIDAMNAPAAQANTIRDRIVDLTDHRAGAFERYSAVIDNFALKGGDPAVVETYRAYRTSILVGESQQADFQTLAKKSLAWATDADGGLALAMNIAIVLISLMGLFLLARIIRGYARRLTRRIPDLSLLLQAFFATVVYWLTIAIGLMVVLSALGVDVTPLFAIVGGASFILAFAMQDTLGNLAAGLMIMFNRPFDEGDYITAGGISGTVASVSIVSTTVKTPDNQVIVIPNSKVWGDVITNTTASPDRRVDLVFGIDYGDDPDKAADIILNVVNADPRVLQDPEPWVRVTNLGDSSVDLTTRIWCKAEDFWELKFALMKEVKLAFDRGGISIPYPHSVEIQKVET